MKKILLLGFLFFFLAICEGNDSNSSFPKICAKEGQTIKQGSNTSCCKGLTPLNNFSVENLPYYEEGRLYKKPGCVRMVGQIICIECGDGVCGEGENKCNCPQDCDPKGCLGEGESFSPQQDKRCCAGLDHEWNYKKLPNGSCSNENGWVCLKCRDGICGKGENGCNCPMDCKDFKCKGHGEVPLYTNPADDMSIQCCKGLKHRAQKQYFYANCQEEPMGGYYGICLSCGDRICDTRYESKCNCPEDCK